MKSKLLYIIVFLAVCMSATAQTPYAFNYQSVVRDANGQLLPNQSVGIQITIRHASATGAQSYQETFTKTTNDYALVNLKVGNGNIGFGAFDTINWGEGPYFMEVSMDFSGGNNYTVMGSSQLVSVPFALHAKTADNTFSGDYGDLSNSPTNISFFTNDAGYLLTEMDGDSTNEIQALTLSNDTIFLSNGGFVKLPAPIFGFNGLYSGLIGAPTNVSHFTNDAGYLTSEVDGDSTNEIQSLSLSADTLFLSEGGNVNLSSYDNTAAISTNTTAIAGNTTSISTNTGNISTNTAGVSTNASGISTNASGITTNATTIAGNTTSISTNTGNISTNASGISTNASGISTNASGISTNATAIAGNTTSISTNTGNISTNTSGISTNSTAISSNASNISINASSISTNTNNIATNTTGIATNAINLSTHITSDLDTDSSNEIQNLSLSGTTLSLSSSNSVDLQDASVWDTNTVGTFYNENIGVGGVPQANKAIVINTDSMATDGIIQYGSAANFNFMELYARENNKRVSIGMGDSTNFGNSFTIGVNPGSGWTDPFIIQQGAPTNSIKVLSNGNIGIGEANPEFKIHANGDSIVVFGYSSGQHVNNWRNVGVQGDINTSSNPGRAISGKAFGANYGMGVRGEAETDMENQGVSGIALSKPANTINQFGVYGEARKGWGETNAGTGTHFGGYFAATGEGAFNIGASGNANTPGTGTNRGVSGSANSNTASGNFGTIGFAQGAIAGTNRGAYGQANNSTGTNYGVNGAAYGAGTNQTGVYGYANGSTGYNYGVDGTTEATGDENVGVGGFAYGTNTGAKKNFGVFGYAQNADTNYGVFATVTGSNNVNYGTYSEASGGALANYGVYGKVTNTTAAAGLSYGIFGLSDGVSAISNTGIRGHGMGSSVENTGVFGYASGSSTYGVGVNAQSFNSGANSYGIFAYGGASSNNKAGYFVGDVTITGSLNVTGSIAKGSGTFKIDHPLDPENKYLVHSFVESPEMMNVYSGNIITDGNGFATVDLPTYFESANKDFRYQLTVMGSFAQAIIKEKISGNKFVIQTNNPNVEVSWQVTGVRSDKYAEANRVVSELEKKQKGTYLHPELFGESAIKSESAEAMKLIHNPKEDENMTNKSSSKGANKGFLKSKQTKKVKASPEVEEKSIQKNSLTEKTQQKEYSQQSVSSNRK